MPDAMAELVPADMPEDIPELVLPDVPDDIPEVVPAELPIVPLAAVRALSTAFGDVRTTVPVSLRGTAWRLASAAVWGVTPTPTGACVGFIGALLPVCA